ncbi:hypothetical protein ACOSQ2_003568 [Xanthoceras sorbifolium]
MPFRPFVISVLGRLCSVHALFWCCSVRLVLIWSLGLFLCFPCSAPWSPLPAGSLKLNTDAAVMSGLSVMGSGAVVRDSQGKVVAVSAKPLLGFFPAELGELLALREGLLLAKELSLIIEWVELDAVNIVARVFNSFPSAFMDPIVNDVKALFRDVGVSNCHAILVQGMEWHILLLP